MDEGKKYLGESGFKSGLSSFFQGIKTLLAKKQDKLTAGDNITITNNKISSKNSVYTAGTNIEVSSDNQISAKVSADTFTGTLPVAKGGTGVTTQDKINQAFVAQLPVGNDDVTDGTEFVSSYASNNGFSDTNALNVPHRRKFSSVWNYIKDKISSVLGLTKDTYGGNAATAANKRYINLDLSSLSSSNFYPVVFITGANFAEVEIHSPSLTGSATYNQNRIKFMVSANGWSDCPKSLNILEYANYDNSEITIGCIGFGDKNGAWAIWLRGGMNYACFSLGATPILKTSDWTHGSYEKFTVGTNYYGGNNSDVSIVFTPQTTLKSGTYFNRGVKTPEIIVTGRLTIPTSAPSSPVNGDIWIG